tara:strand:+ start:75 stop:221 length:147 start_codon:yes stop_codon:yes gene_type:complete
MELLIQAPADDAQNIAEMLKEEMIKAFNYYADSVPMEVEAVIADHWVH